MNVRKPDPEKLREMRVLLKAAYDCVASEEVPKHMDALVRRLQ